MAEQIADAGARHLLGLALLLLVDMGFVYNESGIADPGVGMLIAAVATFLACIKVGLILWWLDIAISIRAAVVLVFSLGSMYILPIVVRAIAHDGFLHPPQAMAVWACVGLLVGLHALPKRWLSIKPNGSADHLRLQRLIVFGLVVLPVLSLIAHAGAALWVYENAFEPSMLSPILLGVAAVMLRQQHALGGGKATARAGALVVASAVVAALFPGEALIYASNEYTWLAVSPLRVVLTLCPALLLWGWWISGRGFVGLINSLLPMLASTLGHTPSAMLGHLDWLAVWLEDHLPTTRLQWGTTAISAAFACLLLGGMISWLSKRREHRGLR